MSNNQTVNQASEVLASSGQPAVAQQLQAGAASLPGATTTAAMLINGNPKGATSILGRIAPELDSPALSSMMRFGGMAGMFSMIQNIMPMLTNMFSGMGGGILGNLGNSGGIAMMGNNPGNPLAKIFTDMAGVNPASVRMASVDPNTGTTGAAFAAPSINTPAAVPLQQNTLAAVPGLSPPAPSR